MSRLSWNGRNLIQAVVRCCINCLCFNNICLLFITVECDCVSNQGIIGNDGDVSFRDPFGADSCSGYPGLHTLTALNDLTHSPVCIIFITRNHSGKLIADLMSFFYRDCLMNLSISVIESDSPCIRIGCAEKHCSDIQNLRNCFFNCCLSLF